MKKSFCPPPLTIYSKGWIILVVHVAYGVDPRTAKRKSASSVRLPHYTTIKMSPTSPQGSWTWAPGLPIVSLKTDLIWSISSWQVCISHARTWVFTPDAIFVAGSWVTFSLLLEPLAFSGLNLMAVENKKLMYCVTNPPCGQALCPARKTTLYTTSLYHASLSVLIYLSDKKLDHGKVIILH